MQTMRPRDVRSPGPAVRSVESALRRFATVMVPAWAVVITAAGLAEPWQPLVVLIGCLALLGAGFAVFVTSGSAHTWWLLAPMMVGSLAVAGFGAIGRDLVGYPMLALWLNITTLTLGILWQMRHAAVAAAVIVAACLGIVWQEHLARAIAVERSALLSVGVIALGVGMLVAVPAGMLRRTAEEGDSLAAAADAVAVDAAILDGRRVELRKVQRVLHDTVMNTLGAVARWDASDRNSVAARCAADLAILQRAEMGSADDPGVLLESVVHRAHLLGIDIDLHAPDTGPALPPGVAPALEGAAWETLNNTSKHVRDRRAFVDWSWDGRAGHLRVTDAGPGVDGLSWTHGGVESIVRRCEEAGVTARIRSSPDSGTVVDLVWTADRAGSGHQVVVHGVAAAPARPLDRLFAETLVQVCGVVVCVGMIATVALPGAVRWSSLAGVVAVLGVGCGAWAVQHGHARWRVPAVCYPALALLGTWFTGFGLEGCSRVGSWWWGSLVGIAVGVAAILMDGRGWVVVAAASGFAAGNALVAMGLGPATTACHPDVVIDTLVGVAGLAGLWAFRGHLTRTWEQAAEQQATLIRERSRAAVAAEAVRARRSMLGLARSVAEPVLVGLAEGDLDPGDPAVRAWSARAEGTLRALAAVPVADAGGAGRSLMDLVLSAHDRGLELTLGLHADLDQKPDVVLAGAEMLERALAVCPRGSAVQVTVLQSVSGLQCVVLIEPPTPVAPLRRALEAAGWTVTVVGDEVLAETQWETQA